MSTRKFPTPSFLCTFLLSAAMALSLSGTRSAQAADPSPPSAKSEAKAEAKAEEKAPKVKPAPAGKAVPAVGTEAARKEITVKGEMTCAKCGLHEASKCQNVLRVKDAGGKETKYYLAKNPVSEEQHEKVCSGTAPATVTGKVSDEGGKKVITASNVKFE